ncbi:MAG: hypothetical protein FWD82_00500 [Defluviitaleaceae bacterium]|nr:hypothetical protein [Defluviitaleaceae bacterium]
MNCKSCGSPLQEGEVVCFSCGSEVTAEPFQHSPPQPWQNQLPQGQPWMGVDGQPPPQHNFGHPSHNGFDPYNPPIKPPQWFRGLAIALPIISWILNVLSATFFNLGVGTVGFRIGLDITSVAIAISGIVIIAILNRKYEGQKTGCFLAIAIFALIVAVGNTITEAVW